MCKFLNKNMRKRWRCRSWMVVNSGIWIIKYALNKGFETIRQRRHPQHPCTITFSTMERRTTKAQKGLLPRRIGKTGSIRNRFLKEVKGLCMISRCSWRCSGILMEGSEEIVVMSLINKAVNNQDWQHDNKNN